MLLSLLHNFFDLHIRLFPLPTALSIVVANSGTIFEHPSDQGHLALVVLLLFCTFLNLYTVFEDLRLVRDALLRLSHRFV